MLKSISSEKKLVKPLKNCFFGTNLHKKGVIVGHTQNKKQFFLAEITKADHQNSETFYFIKTYVLTELMLMFFVKKVSFPAKTADDKFFIRHSASTSKIE